MKKILLLSFILSTTFGVEIITNPIGGNDKVAVLDFKFTNGKMEIFESGVLITDIQALKNELKLAITANKITNLYILRSNSAVFDRKIIGEFVDSIWKLSDNEYIYCCTLMIIVNKKIELVDYHE